jgi:hypothetical protein
VTYADSQILDEAAYVAAAFHWSLAEILDLEHADRAHFLAAARRLHVED